MILNILQSGSEGLNTMKVPILLALIIPLFSYSKLNIQLPTLPPLLPSIKLRVRLPTLPPLPPIISEIKEFKEKIIAGLKKRKFRSDNIAETTTAETIPTKIKTTTKIKITTTTTTTTSTTTTTTSTLLASTTNSTTDRIQLAIQSKKLVSLVISLIKDMKENTNDSSWGFQFFL